MRQRRSLPRRYAVLVFLLFWAGGVQAEPAIRIGATLALSGKLAYMGQAEMKGAQLAVERINQLGGVSGRPLELLVEDNLGDPKTAVTGVTKLFGVDRIDLLMSAFTHITMAVKDVAAKNKKVMLYQSGLKKIARENPLFFRDYYNSVDVGGLCGRKAVARGYKKAGIIAEMSDSCLEFLQGFESAVAASDLQIMRPDTFNPGEVDFRSLLLRYKAALPDALVVCAWRDAVLFMRQLKEAKMIGLPTLHFGAQNSPEADTPEMRRLYEENRTVSSWYGLLESSRDARQQAFFDEYRARFAETPRPDSAFFYDDVHALAKALGRCSGANPVDQRCLAGALAAVDYDGVAGRVRFDSERAASRPVFLVQVKNGIWVEAD